MDSAADPRGAVGARKLGALGGAGGDIWALGTAASQVWGLECTRKTSMAKAAATWRPGGAPSSRPPASHQSSAFSESSQKRANLWVSGKPDLSCDSFKSGLQFLISGILVITMEMVSKTYLVSGNAEVTPSRARPQRPALPRASVCGTDSGGRSAGCAGSTHEGP